MKSREIGGLSTRRYASNFPLAASKSGRQMALIIKYGWWEHTSVARLREWTNDREEKIDNEIEDRETCLYRGTEIEFRSQAGYQGTQGND